MGRSIIRAIWRVVAAAGAWIVALYVLFFEWGWEPLARALGVLVRLPAVRWIEARIAALPPYAALAVFGVPTAALLPVKLLALALVARGHAVLGVVVILAAKVIGTAIVARLFMLTQPSLMRLAWFARGFARWMVFKAVILERARASLPWRLGRGLKAVTRRRINGWLRRFRSPG
jgi:hypothetical protein